MPTTPMPETVIDGFGLTDVFVNSQRRLYIVTGTITQVVTFIPTIKISEKTGLNETKWNDSGNIDANGMSTENGHVTAYAYSYDVETKAFAANDTAPALYGAIATILGCKRRGGFNIRFQFIIDEGNGMTNQPWTANFDVLNPISVDGDTKDDMPIKFELKQRGAATVWTGGSLAPYVANNAIASAT